MFRLLFPSLALSLALAATALAHPGPRIWISVDAGVVVTYDGPYPPGDPNDYAPAVVFTEPLVNIGGDIWETEFPGYQRLPAGVIAVGTTFEYDITGPLLWYNDTDGCPFFEPVETHFAGSPPAPQMAVTNELFQTQFTDGGFVSGNAAFTYNGGAGDHNHLAYTLLGDGATPGGGPDGVYALPLRLRAAGLATSETYYILLGKNVSATELADAKAALLNPPATADFDCDGDVDLGDFSQFALCFGGANAPPAGTCPEGVDADFDNDGDVDLTDFSEFSLLFTGAM